MSRNKPMPFLEENGDLQMFKNGQDVPMENCPLSQMQHTVYQDTRTLDKEEEVPESFAKGWRIAIRKEENQMQQKFGLSKRVLKWLSMAAVFVLIFAGTLLTKEQLNPNTAPMAKQSKSSSFENMRGTSYSYTGDESTGLEMPGAQSGDMDYGRSAVAEGTEEAALSPVETKPAKIIRTFSLEISTRDFEKDLKELVTLVSKDSGYIEYSDISMVGKKRHGSLIVRVPTQNVDAFISKIKAVGRAISFSESAEDVSERYSDLDTRLKTQRAKMERLQEMLKKATSIKELLEIEDSIANTQYQIDNLAGSLKGLDSKINYSTVRITILEEHDEDTTAMKDATFGERIVSGLRTTIGTMVEFFGDMVIFVIAISPYLLILVCIIIAMKMIKKRRRKTK